MIAMIFSWEKSVLYHLKVSLFKKRRAHFDSHFSNDTNWFHFRQASQIYFQDKLKLKHHTNIFWPIRKDPCNLNHFWTILTLYKLPANQFWGRRLIELLRSFACPSPILARHLLKTPTHWNLIATTIDNHRDGKSPISTVATKVAMQWKHLLLLSNLYIFWHSLT